MKEKVSLDTLAKFMTTMVFVIIVTVAYFMLNDTMNNEIPVLAPEIVLGLFLATVIISWGYHPVSYEITDDTLLIHRPFSALKISKEQIVNVESIDAAKLRYGIRLFASGGFFGYFGLYSAKSIGRYYRYTGHSNNLVMIETDKKRFVISPDSEAFAKAVLAL